MKKNNALRAAALLAAFSVTNTWATDGYFPHGFGMKSKGMGGAAVAVTDNAFAGINNPAASAWAGNRAELGVDLAALKASREAEQAAASATAAYTATPDAPATPTAPERGPTGAAPIRP